MVSAYQAQEAAAQQQQYDMAETGGALTAPPSPSTFAETQARGADPAGAQTHDFLGAVDQFKQILGGWQ